MYNTAANLKIPQLFHYQPFNSEYLEALLIGNQVKLSNPKKFNDPWDCKHKFSKSILNNSKTYSSHVEYFVGLRQKAIGITEAELAQERIKLQTDRVYMERFIDEISQATFDAVTEQYRIYCLSKTPYNPLMWSHYSDKHQGVCLCFNVKSPIFSSALEVNYQKNYPELDITNQDDSILLNQTFLTKADVWTYEEEFRFIGKNGETEAYISLNDDFLNLNQSDLLAVIVGCQMLSPEIDRLRQLIKLRSTPIKLYQAKQLHTEYSLKIQEI